MDTTISSMSLRDSGKCFVTQEWVVIGTRTASVVSQAGDSGGLLVNEGDRAVAMIIAGIVRQTTGLHGKAVNNITVVTPARKLLKWWKEDLGREMEYGEPGA
ncbi:hypothetical protein BGX38DRAFT_1232844 [Terfezia claveryi]|nr:hypothetical protein BGX38DRAFT_1232844 [Terfezia claveryi]